MGIEEINMEYVTSTLVTKTGVLMFPDEVEAFAKDWVVVKQTDKDGDLITGVYYHIRKRKEEEHPGKVIVDSMEE